MESIIIGQIAALVTSCLWTFNIIFFTEAGQRIGSLSVNAYRIILAVVLLSITHFILLGDLLPVASIDQWFWIGMSGIIGLGIGDFGLFTALLLLGPRRSAILMSLSPIFASIGAFLVLGEVLSLPAIAGMAITLAGVVWVVLEREDKLVEKFISNKKKKWGLFLALVGAIGQGLGLVFAKKGIFLEPAAVLNPLSATLMRMMIGSLFVWVAIITIGRFSELRSALTNKIGLKYTAIGAVIGPFIGVVLSMVAVVYAHTGIVQTLMSLMPVFIIPVVWIIYGQKTSLRGIFGAGIAIIGITILFFV